MTTFKLNFSVRKDTTNKGQRKGTDWKMRGNNITNNVLLSRKHKSMKKMRIAIEKWAKMPRDVQEVFGISTRDWAGNRFGIHQLIDHI